MLHSFSLQVTLGHVKCPTDFHRTQDLHRVSVTTGEPTEEPLDVFHTPIVHASRAKYNSKYGERQDAQPRKSPTVKPCGQSECPPEQSRSDHR